jgi:hypothetical protein
MAFLLICSLLLVDWMHAVTDPICCRTFRLLVPHLLHCASVSTPRSLAIARVFSKSRMRQIRTFGSRPAQRSLTLRPAWTFCTTETSAVSLPPPLL